MIQQAIYFTQDNASAISATLIDYTDPTELIDDHKHLFRKDEKLVVVKSVMPNGLAVLSHVIPESMFWANAHATDLNENTFVNVSQL
jgi:hypothetical protein